MITKPTNAELDSIGLNLSNAILKETYSAQFYAKKSGVEHYRLLSYLASKVKGKIVEVGTYEGLGALALNNGKVETFDIHKQIHPEIEEVVKFHNRKAVAKDFKKAELIFIDISHNGADEVELMEEIYKSGFKGMIVFDDIKLNAEMVMFWDFIKEKHGDKAEDWSDVAHWAGSGVLFI